MYPGRYLQVEQNVEIPMKPLIINHLNIPDEFDTPAIAKQLIDNKHVCIFGDVPGVGKSHACKYLDTLGYNVLLVCPNELVNHEISAKVNRFFQVGVSEDTKRKKFDDSLFDVIVFDEMF